MGLCLIGVIVGEFLVSRCGIGYLIVYGSQDTVRNLSHGDFLQLGGILLRFGSTAAQKQKSSAAGKAAFRK